MSMSHHHHNNSLDVTESNCSTCQQFKSEHKGAGLLSDGIGMTSYAHESVNTNNNAHLGASSGRSDPHNNTHLGPTSARDEETLSAGSTARAESNAYRMSNTNGDLEKDFSTRNGPNGK
jgi:hypothetical protein